MMSEPASAKERVAKSWPRIVRPPNGRYRSITGKLDVLRDADGVRVDMSPTLPLRNQILTIVALLIVGGIVAFLLWALDSQGKLEEERGVAMIVIGVGALTALFFAVNPYIRRAALRRLGPAAVIGDDGIVKFPQVNFSVPRDEIIALHSVHGVYLTEFRKDRGSTSIRRHPVVQVFVEHESDGESRKSLAHLGPSNNDDAFREFAENELGVPFTSHKDPDYMELSFGSVSGIRGM